jgi:hypothetical protein
MREKRYIIAGTDSPGIKIAAVARRLGMSRSWASQEANAAGTRIIVAALLDRGVGDPFVLTTAPRGVRAALEFLHFRVNLFVQV